MAVATTLGRRSPGVVAFSDVDAVPGDASHGGGSVVGHDGHDSSVDPPGESFRSLAGAHPEDPPAGRVADVPGGRPPTDADFWRQQRALTIPERPPQSGRGRGSGPGPARRARGPRRPGRPDPMGRPPRPASPPAALTEPGRSTGACHRAAVAWRTSTAPAAAPRFERPLPRSPP